jgi:hypothetical protein
MLWSMDVVDTRVSVPCLPEVKVGEWDLGRRLLMAAVLECRDLGRVELRLVEPPTFYSRRNIFMGDRYVQVRLLDGPPLDGLCGRILERLERKGTQDAYRLLNRVTGRNRMGRGAPHYQRWVLAKVRDELAARGYTKGTSEGLIVFDCQRVQTLAEACDLAVDRWSQAWAADPLLCDVLLAACTESIAEKGGG